MELDGQVGRGGVELLGPTAAQELAQDVGAEIVPVVDREDVALAQVQAAGRETRGAGRACWAKRREPPLRSVGISWDQQLLATSRS